MAVMRMDNVGIVVESLDTAIAFFTELGLKLEGRATVEGEWAGFEINLIRQNAHLEFLTWKGPSYPPAVGMSLPTILQKRILRLVKLDNGEHPDIYTWTTLGRVVANFLQAQVPSSGYRLTAVSRWAPTAHRLDSAASA